MENLQAGWSTVVNEIGLHWQRFDDWMQNSTGEQRLIVGLVILIAVLFINLCLAAKENGRLRGDWKSLQRETDKLVVDQDKLHDALHQQQKQVASLEEALDKADADNDTLQEKLTNAISTTRRAVEEAAKVPAPTQAVNLEELNAFLSTADAAHSQVVESLLDTLNTTLQRYHQLALFALHGLFADVDEEPEEVEEEE